jgi:hypothetical protein
MTANIYSSGSFFAGDGWQIKVIPARRIPAYGDDMASNRALQKVISPFVFIASLPIIFAMPEHGFSPKENTNISMTSISSLKPMFSSMSKMPSS